MVKVTVRSGWAGLLAAVLVIAAALAAYRTSFSGPFVFDGRPTIIDNPSIRHLWPIGPALHPPPIGSPVSGRPIANLSFAINYALGGLEVRGYHALNLLVHILSGLTIFGILRRTVTPSTADQAASFLSRPFVIAIAAAAIWTVHPLQTESVTYVAQRAESLMGLFYLLTLYCFVRACKDYTAAKHGSFAWLGLSLLACLLGMGTKEVMATAPLMVLLYDRSFVAGTFREAWQRRRVFYLGLACTWGLLAYLMAGAGSRGGTVGFGTAMPWWAYALTQFKAIAHYLRLSIWPHPLVIDYGLKWGGPLGVIAVDGLVVAGLVAATVIGILRRSPLGYLGAWFFVILAPSSSVVPIATEIIAEHRMYLPLAAVVVLAVVGLYDALGKKSLAVFCALALGLAFLTSRRNEDYRSAQALWTETVECAPGNPGAHNNLGKAFLEAENLSAAKREFTETLRLDPGLPGARNNLGVVLFREGNVTEAIAEYEAALRLAPRYADAAANLGRALTQEGRISEAIARFKEALQLEPDNPGTLVSLGAAYLRAGRLAEAIAEYNEALRTRPDSVEAHNSLAFALYKMGRKSEAIAEYKETLRLKPELSDAHYDLGNVLAASGLLPAAVEEFSAALRVRPDFAEAEGNLGVALLNEGRVAESIGHFEKALQLQPDLVEAELNLGSAMVEMGKTADAIPHFEAAVRLRPGYGAAHYDLAIALRLLGRTEEARAQFEEASRLGVKSP